MVVLRHLSLSLSLSLSSLQSLMHYYSTIITVHFYVHPICTTVQCRAEQSSGCTLYLYHPKIVFQWLVGRTNQSLCVVPIYQNNTTIVLVTRLTSWRLTTSTTNTISSPELGQNNVISVRRRVSVRERKNKEQTVLPSSVSAAKWAEPVFRWHPGISLPLLSISDWISP